MLRCIALPQPEYAMPDEAAVEFCQASGLNFIDTNVYCSISYLVVQFMLKKKQIINILVTRSPFSSHLAPKLNL